MSSLPLSALDLFLRQALPVQTAINVDTSKWKALHDFRESLSLPKGSLRAA